MRIHKTITIILTSLLILGVILIGTFAYGGTVLLTN